MHNPAPGASFVLQSRILFCLSFAIVAILCSLDFASLFFGFNLNLDGFFPSYCSFVRLFVY